MFFWRQLKETLQAQKLMNSFTMSTSERHNETGMPFIPKGRASSPYSASSLQLYCASKRRQRETTKSLFMAQRWKNESFLALMESDTANTQHGRLFSLSRNINLGLGKKQSKTHTKKSNNNKSNKSKRYQKKAKKLSFGDVHWNLHTPTGKTVLSCSFLNPSSRLTGTHPFLMPAGIQLFSSCRSLPSLAGSETLSARPDQLWRSSSLFVGF